MDIGKREFAASEPAKAMGSLTGELDDTGIGIRSQADEKCQQWAGAGVKLWKSNDFQNLGGKTSARLRIKRA